MGDVRRPVADRREVGEHRPDLAGGGGHDAGAGYVDHRRPDRVSTSGSAQGAKGSTRFMPPMGHSWHPCCQYLLRTPLAEDARWLRSETCPSHPWSPRTGGAPAGTATGKRSSTRSTSCSPTVSPLPGPSRSLSGRACRCRRSSATSTGSTTCRSRRSRTTSRSMPNTSHCLTSVAARSLDASSASCPPGWTSTSRSRRSPASPGAERWTTSASAQSSPRPATSSRTKSARALRARARAARRTHRRRRGGTRRRAHLLRELGAAAIGPR